MSFLLLALTLTASSLHANISLSLPIDTSIVCDTVLKPDTTTSMILSHKGDILIPTCKDSVPASKFKAKKVIAAVLAFPLPFGILGLHRIFLGTKPYIPFAYLGTLGGCLGVLPLIDFIAILSANEEVLKLYENNPRVFMWSH